jgi:hypothetical protein
MTLPTEPHTKIEADMALSPGRRPDALAAEDALLAQGAV